MRALSSEIAPRIYKLSYVDHDPRELDHEYIKTTLPPTPELQFIYPTQEELKKTVGKFMLRIMKNRKLLDIAHDVNSRLVTHPETPEDTWLEIQNPGEDEVIIYLLPPGVAQDIARDYTGIPVVCMQ